jgi:hypothetical protein
MIAVVLSVIDVYGCKVASWLEIPHSETKATCKPRVLKDVLGNWFCQLSALLMPELSILSVSVRHFLLCLVYCLLVLCDALMALFTFDHMFQYFPVRLNLMNSVIFSRPLHIGGGESVSRSFRPFISPV